jgi:hypothetical protein
MNNSESGDRIESTSQEFDPLVHEISVMRQIILERVHALDLLRELVSNAAAKEVGATEITIKYTVDDAGHVFEVKDNGCGMNYTGNPKNPGRLDRFFGLGLSSIVGIKGDEFAWKGLGSKLAYNSCRLEIETACADGNAHRVEINEPWETIERNLKPKPKIFHYPSESTKTGTAIRVIGHPPHIHEGAYSVEEVETFLRHRTFIGYTGKRENPPKITLSVLGQSKVLPFGFRELNGVDAANPPEGTLPIHITDSITKSGTNKTVQATLKGFITWDSEQYNLSPSQMNCGLLLSVRGIPYFELDMETYGSRSMGIVNPGWKKCCLVLECDSVQEDMNISRSGLVDAERPALLKQLVAKMFEKLEQSPEYLAFRQIPKKRKNITGAEDLSAKKIALELENQKWVVWKNPKTGKSTMLSREPENENDTLAILWKLEALGGLPFKQFQTLAHAGYGPDLIVHFQEDNQSNPERYVSVEAESKFNNYIAHGHTPSLFPRVVCWDIGPSPKMRMKQTDKSYKVIAEGKDIQVHVYCIRKMEGIQVLTKSQVEEALKNS